MHFAFNDAMRIPKKGSHDTFEIIFASPLYFLLRGKIGPFIINSLFYGIAVLLLITIFGAIFALIP